MTETQSPVFLAATFWSVAKFIITWNVYSSFSYHCCLDCCCVEGGRECKKAVDTPSGWHWHLDRSYGWLWQNTMVRLCTQLVFAVLRSSPSSSTWPTHLLWGVAGCPEKLLLQQQIRSAECANTQCSVAKLWCLTDTNSMLTQGVAQPPSSCVLKPWHTHIHMHTFTNNTRP